eukprot:scaffold3323_cov122-Isochrysis_galbana.AAC.1
MNITQLRSTHMHLERASPKRGSHPAAACSFAIAAHSASSFGAAARRQRPLPTAINGQDQVPIIAKL